MDLRNEPRSVEQHHLRWTCSWQQSAKRRVYQTSCIIEPISSTFAYLRVSEGLGSDPSTRRHGRAFHQLDELLLDSADAQNQCDQWLKFRINVLAAIINVSAGLLALFHYGGMSPGLVGLSLSKGFRTQWNNFEIGLLAE